MKRTTAALLAGVLAFFGAFLAVGSASAAPAYPPQPPVLTVGTGVVGGPGVSVCINNMKPGTTVNWSFSKVAEAALFSLARTATSGSATSTVDADGVSCTVLPITEAGRYSVTATGTNSAGVADSRTGQVVLTATSPGVTPVTATTAGVTFNVGPGLKPGTTLTITMTGCGSTITGSATVGADGRAVVSITGAEECTYTVVATGTKADGSAFTSTSQVQVLGIEEDCTDSSAAGSDCASGGGSDDSDDSDDSSAAGGSDDSADEDGIAATGAGDSVTLLTVGAVALLVGGGAVVVARSRRWGKDAA